MNQDTKTELIQPDQKKTDRLFVADEHVVLSDLAGRRNRLFYRHTVLLLLRRIWLPVILAALLGFLGVIAGYATHTKAYRKDFSVNVGVQAGSMVSGREAASTALALLDSTSYYEKVRAMLDFDMRLQDCEQAVSLGVPLETDVIRFTILSDEPEQVRQLAEAAKIVAHDTLEFMPQISEIQWNDGQTEIRDQSRSVLTQTLFFALVFAVLGGIIGIVLVFISILCGKRIHFTDEADFSSYTAACSLIRSPSRRQRNKITTAVPDIRINDEKAKADQPAGDKASQSQNTVAGIILPTDIGHEISSQRQRPEIHESALLFATRILEQIDNMRQRGENGGISLLLLPSDDILYYRDVVPLIASAFRSMEERVLVLDFTEDALFCDRSGYLVSDISVLSAHLLPELSLKDRMEHFAASMSEYDISIVVYPNLSGSPDTLAFQKHCDITVPLVSLHKTKMAALKKTINHLAYLNRHIDAIAYVCQSNRDLQHNLI